MTNLKRFAAVAVFAIGLGVGATSADAAIHKVDASKAQVLAQKIEAALAKLGPDASADDAAAAIQTAITLSGDDPYVARAALRLVDHDTSLTANDLAGAASVDQTIDEALAGSGVPHSGGQGGGNPIGTPPTYTSGGGSDYLPK